MSYIAKELKHRITIMQATNEPTLAGGFARGYKKLLTLWAGKKQVGSFIMQIRSVNAEKSNNNSPIDTDEFKVRYDSIVSNFERTFAKGFQTGFDSHKSNGMGKRFDNGFDNGFDSLIDMFPVKADYFVFLQSGNNDAYRGRLYKINRIVLDDNTKEFALLRCNEVQEMGLGAKI